MIEGIIEFKNPRQKMWGVLKDKELIQLPFGHETDKAGEEITSYSTNCYEDALEEAHTLIAKGTGTKNVQIIEFVPYNYMMQPGV